MSNEQHTQFEARVVDENGDQLAVYGPFADRNTATEKAGIWRYDQIDRAKRDGRDSSLPVEVQEAWVKRYARLDKSVIQVRTITVGKWEDEL